jgi:hypothetical protein
MPRFTVCSVAFLCVFVAGIHADDFVFPANEYEYSVKRDALRAAEMKMQGLDNSLTEVGKLYL